MMKFHDFFEIEEEPEKIKKTHKLNVYIVKVFKKKTFSKNHIKFLLF